MLKSSSDLISCCSLGTVVNESTLSLVRNVEENVEKAADLNRKKTLLKCSEVQAKLEV